MKIHHIALRVSDFEKSLDFYTSGLGFKAAKIWENNEKKAAMVDFGEGFIEIFGSAEKDENKFNAGAYPHFAFLSNDVDLDFSKAVNAKAGVIKAPFNATLNTTPPQELRIAFISGPDGEQIEFFQEI